MASATPDTRQGIQPGVARGRVYGKSITIPSAIRRRVLIFKEVIELASAKCRDNSPTLPHVARLAGAAAAAASCRQIRAATRNCQQFVACNIFHLFGDLLQQSGSVSCPPCWPPARPPSACLVLILCLAICRHFYDLQHCLSCFWGRKSLHF